MGLRSWSVFVHDLVVVLEPPFEKRGDLSAVYKVGQTRLFGSEKARSKND